MEKIKIIMKTPIILAFVLYALLGCSTSGTITPPPRLKPDLQSFFPAGYILDWKAVHLVEPNFPKRELERGIEGWVVVKFYIREDGSTDDVRVLDSSPKQIFDKPAINAVKQFFYTYTGKNSKPCRVTENVIILNFTIQPKETTHKPIHAT